MRKVIRQCDPMAAFAVCLLAVAMVACDDRPVRDPFSPNRGEPMIRLGDAQQFKPTGIYFDFQRDYNIVLVSRPVAAGQMLVALDFRCTHDQNPLRHNSLTNRFECNRCGSRWSADGLIQSGSVAPASLDRYRMRLTGSRASDDRQVIIDTARRYHQLVTRQIGNRMVEVQEWSATDSMYHFENDPRHDPLKGRIETR